MNYKDAIVQLNQKKVKDYSFTVAFFLIFSVFIFFAIRPNIITAIQLRNELVLLKEKDAEYEQLIQKVVEHQSVLEAQRTKLYVLDEAIPQKYLMHYELIDDFNESAASSGVLIDSLNIPEIVLTSKEKNVGLKSIPISFSISGPEDGTASLIKQILQQRRIKQIDEVTLEKDNISSDSANWKSKLNLKAFYYKL